MGWKEREEVVVFFFSFFFLFFLSSPIPFFHIFDEKWLALLIITEQIVEASFTNGGDRQSVSGACCWLQCVLKWGTVGRRRVGLALHQHAGRSWASWSVSCLSTSCSSARLDYDVPFLTRRRGPPASSRPLPNLLGPGWRWDAGLYWSGNGGRPKAPTWACTPLAPWGVQDHRDEQEEAAWACRRGFRGIEVGFYSFTGVISVPVSLRANWRTSSQGQNGCNWESLKIGKGVLPRSLMIMTLRL